MTKLLPLLLAALFFTGCAGIHQMQQPPLGSHPENAPTPSGKVLNGSQANQ